MGNSQSTPPPSPASLSASLPYASQKSKGEDQYHQELADFGLQLSQIYRVQCVETLHSMDKTLEDYHNLLDKRNAKLKEPAHVPDEYVQPTEEKSAEKRHLEEWEAKRLAQLKRKATQLNLLHHACMIRALYGHEEKSAALQEDQRGRDAVIDTRCFPSLRNMNRVAVINSVSSDTTVRDDDHGTLDQAIDCIRTVSKQEHSAQEINRLTEKIDSIPSSKAINLFGKYLSFVSYFDERRSKEEQPRDGGSLTESVSVCREEFEALNECMTKYALRDQDLLAEKTTTEDSYFRERIERTWDEKCYIAWRRAQTCQRSVVSAHSVSQCLHRHLGTEPGSSQSDKWQYKITTPAFSRCVSSDATVIQSAINAKSL